MAYHLYVIECRTEKNCTKHFGKKGFSHKSISSSSNAITYWVSGLRASILQHVVPFLEYIELERNGFVRKYPFSPKVLVTIFFFDPTLRINIQMISMAKSRTRDNCFCLWEVSKCIVIFLRYLLSAGRSLAGTVNVEILVHMNIGKPVIITRGQPFHKYHPPSFCVITLGSFVIP